MYYTCILTSPVVFFYHTCILAWLKAPKTHHEAKAAEQKDETIEKLRSQLKEVVSGGGGHYYPLQSMSS